MIFCRGVERILLERGLQRNVAISFELVVTSTPFDEHLLRLNRMAVLADNVVDLVLDPDDATGTVNSFIFFRKNQNTV